MRVFLLIALILAVLALGVLEVVAFPTPSVSTLPLWK